MRTSFLIVDKDTTINNLVALLHGDSYAAVTADDGAEFLGLITRSDVLNYLRRLHQGSGHGPV
jgi:predicted transcriptional regulator